MFLLVKGKYLKLEELLKNVPKRKITLCVIRRIADDTYYRGHYGAFSDTEPPKVYKQKNHARLAIHQFAAHIFNHDPKIKEAKETLSKEFAGKDWHEYRKEELARGLNWSYLSKEQKYVYEDNYYEIVEIN